MNNASLYSTSNNLQKNDAQYVIDTYFDLLKWGNNENIMDVGSGDGGVTLELLLPKLPNNFNRLLGTDLCEEMVTFAKKRVQNDKRIDFSKMDIGSGDFSVEFYEHFDHIFSFYCLHWVADQRLALKNIFEMLKPGGEILLLFLASTPMYDIYEAMEKSGKWGPHMANYKKFISPYHHINNPVTEMEQNLKDVGFVSNLCKTEPRTYTFANIAALKKAVLAVSPFLSKMSDKEKTDFVEDYVEKARKVKNVEFISCENNNEEKVYASNLIFIAHASKPKFN